MANYVQTQCEMLRIIEKYASKRPRWWAGRGRDRENVGKFFALSSYDYKSTTTYLKSIKTSLHYCYFYKKKTLSNEPQPNTEPSTKLDRHHHQPEICVWLLCSALRCSIVDEPEIEELLTHFHLRSLHTNFMHTTQFTIRIRNRN